MHLCLWSRSQNQNEQQSNNNESSNVIVLGSPQLDVKHSHLSLGIGSTNMVCVCQALSSASMHRNVWKWLTKQVVSHFERNKLLVHAIPTHAGKCNSINVHKLNACEVFCQIELLGMFLFLFETPQVHGYSLSWISTKAKQHRTITNEHHQTSSSKWKLQPVMNISSKAKWHRAIE